MVWRVVFILESLTPLSHPYTLSQRTPSSLSHLTSGINRLCLFSTTIRSRIGIDFRRTNVTKRAESAVFQGFLEFVNYF